MSRHLSLYFVLSLALLPNAACQRAATTTGPTVAFVSNNPFEFWAIARKGTDAAAKEFGVRCEFKMPPGGTAAEQRQIIDDLLAKGVKGIAVSPNDAANQVDFYQGVNKRVSLLTVDSDVPDPAARKAYLGTDNVAAGRAVGKVVKQAVPKGGKVIIFVGKLDVQNAVERRLGVVTELAGGADKITGELEKLKANQYPIKFGDYELLDTMTDDAKAEVCRQKVDDALNRYPDVAALIGLWAYNPPAILEGVKAAPGKLGKVVIVGFDENEETLQGVKDGHIAATVVQNPYEFGYQSVKLLAALAKGDPKALDRSDKNAQGQIFIPHRIITKTGDAVAFPNEKVEGVEPFHKKLKELKGG